MSGFQFGFPAGLGGIDRQKADEAGGILGHIVRDIPVIDPNAAQGCFASENDSPEIFPFRKGRCVVFVAHREIHFNARAGPAGFLPETGAKMRGVLPRVGMNIDDHQVGMVAWGNGWVKSSSDQSRDEFRMALAGIVWKSGGMV